jgi:multidrug resistance efflux pump
MATQPDPIDLDSAALEKGAPTIIQLPPQPDTSGLAQLLQFEGEARRHASVNELVYFMANETRRIVGYDQMFVLREARMGAGFHVLAASSLAVVDRNAPLIHAVEAIISGIDAAHLQDIDPLSASDDGAVATYPFPFWHWSPLKDRAGRVFAGLLLVRHQPFRDGEQARIARVAETAQHAWCALTGGTPVSRLPKLDTRKKRWLGIAAIAVALFPVRLTALAPVEVVPARPFVVSAPFAGVIARLQVAPNEKVAAGQPVLTFEDIKVRNEMQQAIEKLQVAKAKIERSTSAAFGKADEARDISTLRAEYQLAQADYNYARDLMAKSQIVAPVGGMAIYSDRRDWEGRAVNVGEPILQIADPAQVSFRIDLPTKEQMTIAPGSIVKVWLDAEPLWSLDGRVEQASYQARPTAEGILAFAVTAKPVTGRPRIGSRGTAKLYGKWVPFAYSVFKRPIASIRQYLGL